MIPDPAPNTITRPYRGLSVQEVDIPLTPTAIEALLRSREIYRRTALPGAPPRAARPRWSRSGRPIPGRCSPR